MDKNQALDAFSALSQLTRLDVLRLLIAHEPDGLAAGDIAARLGVPQNTLSTHLGILARAGLADGERHGRSIVYRANLDQLRGLVGFLVADCCAGHPERCAPFCACSLERKEPAMPDKIYNVLFLCTGNSARSIIAESILNQDGAGRFRAFSAGSHPAGKVNPFALKILESHGYSTEGARSKSWDEFAVPGAPQMDFVFTVCDNAAGEACPVWPGQPMTAHWGIEDPAAVAGTDIEKQTAFVAATRYLKNRISAFLALPVGSIDRLALSRKLKDIGQLEGATTLAGEKA